MTTAMVRMVPEAWLKRVEEAFGQPAPGWRAEHTRWVRMARQLPNYDYPIVNPLDDRVLYKPYARLFMGNYVGVLINIAKEQMRKSRNEGSDVQSTFAHVDKFMQKGALKQRDFHKMRYWGLIREQSMTSEDMVTEDKIRKGEWRLTRYGWLMLTDRIKIARVAHVFLNKVIGFSGPMINCSDAMMLEMSYKWSSSIKPPKGQAWDVTCARCGEEHLTKFVQLTVDDTEKKYCFGCVPLELANRRTELMGSDLVTYIYDKVPTVKVDPWGEAFGSWCAKDPRRARKSERLEVPLNPSGDAVLLRAPASETKVSRTLPLFEED